MKRQNILIMLTLINYYSQNNDNMWEYTQFQSIGVQYQQHQTYYSMSRNQTEIACSYALQHIINHGAQMARDNRTVKRHLFGFATRANQSVANELVLHAGIKNQGLKLSENNQIAPQNLKKDKRCIYSVNISPSRQESNRQSKFDKFNKDTANTRSPLLTRRSSVQTNRKALSRGDRTSDNKLVDISDLIQSTNGKIVTQGMKNQDKYIQILRQNCQQEQNARNRQKEKDDEDCRKNQERVQQLKNRFHKHMSQKNNNYSYDTDGNYIFFEAEAQHHALRRKYPPSNLSYQLDQPEDPEPERHSQPHIKQKAARGQAFASAVLKTMNMSKFSLNMTSKTCNIDEFAFMKRNDLFNNNHTRQTTTIPYLQVCQGTNYTETNTNLSVSKKKTERTSHSENKSKFKNYQLDYLKDNTDKHNNKTQIIEPGIQLVETDKRRIQSSRPYMRPKTCIPKTAKTTDRIISVNEQLKFELIE